MNFLTKVFSSRTGKPGFVSREILHDGDRTKRVAELLHIRHDHAGNDGLALNLYKFDKTLGADWDSGAVQEKEISLAEGDVKKLFDYLSQNYAAIGIRESGQYAMIPLSGQIDATHRSVIQRVVRSVLVTQNPELINELISLVQTDRQLLLKLKNFTKCQEYKEAVDKLKVLLGTSTNEQDYKNWFKTNPWVFGTEYLQRIDISQIGLRQRIDLCFTSADGYQDIVELKGPDVDVFNEDSHHPGNFYVSAPVAAVIGQCSNYLYELEENRHNIERLYHVPFIKPRARVVIGRSNRWSEDKKQALRKLNAVLHNIEVITYDYILTRGAKMIEYYEE